ncbi:LPS translocon maturation chaperone LptM [Alteromonas sp. a30]|uniref:LPS translocon maturation chaperone LptM n=1 Tax=Alteromonas sp. a30 TaxID=2730917 RepID=UPI003FA3A7EE|nr:lipoprotein [Alteromonas sp. a30]
MKKCQSLVFLLILGLTACGQKGPLYMPDIEKMRNQAEDVSDAKSEQNQALTSEQSGS